MLHDNWGQNFVIYSYGNRSVEIVANDPIMQFDQRWLVILTKNLIYDFNDLIKGSKPSWVTVVCKFLIARPPKIISVVSKSDNHTSECKQNRLQSLVSINLQLSFDFTCVQM